MEYPPVVKEKVSDDRTRANEFSLLLLSLPGSKVNLSPLLETRRTLRLGTKKSDLQKDLDKNRKIRQSPGDGVNAAGILVRLKMLKWLRFLELHPSFYRICAFFQAPGENEVVSQKASGSLKSIICHDSQRHGVKHVLMESFFPPPILCKINPEIGVFQDDDRCHLALARPAVTSGELLDRAGRIAHEV